MRDVGQLLGEGGEVAFEIADAELECADLLTQDGQAWTEARGQGCVRIFEQGADVGDDVAGPDRDRHPELAQQPAHGVEPGRPGPLPRGSKSSVEIDDVHVAIWPSAGTIPGTMVGTQGKTAGGYSA